MRQRFLLKACLQENETGRPATVAPFCFAGLVPRESGVKAGRARGLVLGALGLATLAVGVLWVAASRGLATAEGLARHGLWEDVHAPITRYLWLFPDDPRANLLAAEALVKDDSLPLVKRITESLGCLARIPDDSSGAVAARIAEARVKLFLRYEPIAASRSLERAIQLDPSALELRLLLWKLLELTGRAEEAEDTFWASYELSPDAEKPRRLREWYVSQFFPLTSTAEIDRLMGFRTTASEAGTAVEMKRFQRFRLAEPAEPVPHAALAEFFLRENEPELAFEVLDEAAGQIPQVQQTNPFILGVVVETLLELGETEPARETFERWPQPASGRRYALVKGRVLQEAAEDAGAAAEAYREALSTWPGEIDWRTMNRLAGCLARVGDTEGAAAERQLVQQVQDRIPQDRLQALLDGLGTPDDPLVADAMADFYREIGRPREADAWAGVASIAREGR
jgi:thioredoxin-like negative regulator of GroEL